MIILKILHLAIQLQFSIFKKFSLIVEIFFFVSQATSSGKIPLRNKLYNKPFKSTFHSQTLWMGGNRILSPDVWRRFFTDWLIKCYNGYSFLIWYNFIHFAPLKPRNIQSWQRTKYCVPDVRNKMMLNHPPFYLSVLAVQNHSRLI